MAGARHSFAAASGTDPRPVWPVLSAAMACLGLLTETHYGTVLVTRMRGLAKPVCGHEGVCMLCAMQQRCRLPAILTKYEHAAFSALCLKEGRTGPFRQLA